VSPLRLLVVDDNTAILETLVETLRSHFAVVGALSNGISVLAQAGDLNPDIIVLDILLPDISGYAVSQRLKKAGCPAKIIFLSSYERSDMVYAAFDIGASGYVFKSSMIPDLIDAIYAVSQDDGLFWCSSSSSAPRARQR
jgi:two-component system OmpR family response regulator